ncbi:MAG: hypothetical protein RL385_13 [Pseudomonadota bacterium]|jgi:hypothetical protein
MTNSRIFRPTLSWDDKDEMWVASTKSPAISAKASTTELVLLYFGKALKNAGYRDFEVEPKHELPEELQSKLNECLECAEQAARLTAVRAEFAHMAQGKYAMMQLEAAQMLGLHQSYLGRLTHAQDMKTAITGATKQRTGSTSKKPRP